MSFKITYTDQGAHLSKDGIVTHELLMPGCGLGKIDKGMWSLLELIGADCGRHVGAFESPEHAAAFVDAQQKGGKHE